MKTRLLTTVLLSAFLGPAVRAADEPEPKSHMKEVLRARADEETRKKPLPPPRTPPPATAPAPGAAKPTPPAGPATTEPATVAEPPPAAAAPPAQNPPAKSGGDPATVLPQVEVRKSRITELDRQLALQEQSIAREKKNTKSTETDKALNDPKISSVLSIFGGESSKHRESVAEERVKLMEAERDLIEAIAHAKTKEEKQDLQKQLDEIKTTRRELEKLRR